DRDDFYLKVGLQFYFCHQRLTGERTRHIAPIGGGCTGYCATGREDNNFFAHVAVSTSSIRSFRTRRQSISNSMSTTGGRTKCQVRPKRMAPRRANSSARKGCGL